MRRILLFPIPFIVVVALAACGNDLGPKVEELEGQVDSLEGQVATLEQKKAEL